MDDKQRQRIIHKHRDSLTRHGYHPHALYWSGRDIQVLRFKVLADIGIADGDSVLDVGCGFGDFKGWAKEQGLSLKYTGIDLSPDLLGQAKTHHPDGCFLSGDLFDMNFENQSFDWVILSGALNEQLHDESSYAKSIVKKMYHLSRKGVAFNMLDGRFLRAHDLHSPRPEDILSDAQKLCSSCELHDQYLKNDFSIYMRRV